MVTRIVFTFAVVREQLPRFLSFYHEKYPFVAMLDEFNKEEQQIIRFVLYRIVMADKKITDQKMC